MKSEWGKVNLGDVCDLIPGFAFKSKDFGSYPTKVVKIGDIQPPRVAIDCLEGVNLSSYSPNKLEKYLVTKGDFVLAMTGATIGKLGRILADKPAYINQRVLRFKPKENVDWNFIYYVVNTKDFSGFVYNHIDSETAQPNISAGTLATFSFSIPPLPIQQKIASILSSLDDKIETNNAICRNLEEQARALYELWLSKRKNECEWLSLEAIADLNPEAYSIKEKWGYINYLDTGNITDGVISSIQKIDLEQDELPSRARRKVKAGDVVFSTVRPNQRHFGILHSPLPNMLVSTGFTVIRSNKTDISNELIYLLLSDSSFVEKMQQIGEQSVSAYPSVKPTDIATCLIPFLGSKDYRQMQNVICSMFSQIAALQSESRSLFQARDTLLPKLMSGEIDLSIII